MLDLLALYFTVIDLTLLINHPSPLPWD